MKRFYFEIKIQTGNGQHTAIRKPKPCEIQPNFFKAGINLMSIKKDNPGPHYLYKKEKTDKIFSTLFMYCIFQGPNFFS